jgi:hypothetical protein
VKSLFPFSQETVVTSYNKTEVYLRLWSVTEPTGDEEWEPDVDEDQLLFNGRVDTDTFRLSRKVKRANNFLPQMRGRVESTSLGSIVFIRYRLFLWTLSFLIFWSILTTLFALYFLIYEKIYINAAFSLSLGLANYVIAVLNFRKQVRISSSALREVLA